MKLISWNINGIRAVQKKGFADFISREKPDLLCLQETKIDEEQLDKVEDVDNYGEQLFSCAEKKGYSGVATFVRDGAPLQEELTETSTDNEQFDSEGRFLITRHEDFLLYNVYIPSGTTGEVRQDFKYQFLDHFYEHLENLPTSDKKKLIICGDFNICHKEIDIHHPEVATKRELSGFLPDERAWMDAFVNLGLVDTFRHVHGDIKDVYTWWSYRAGARKKNLGWRLDYFFVSSDLAKKIKHAEILEDVHGSDHCPLSLTLG